MGLPVLHGFERGFHNGGMGSKVGIAHLQTDDVSSAGLQGEDAVSHGNGGGLPDEIELLVEV
jgi:hypothetical protein